MTSLFSASVVPSVKRAQRLLVKQSPNERPPTAVGTLLLPPLTHPGGWGKGRVQKIENTENKLHPQSGWVSYHSSSQLAVPSLTLFHKQPKTSYHLTRLWELGPISPNGKPARPVCWDEITPLDPVHSSPPTAFHPLLCPARQDDLGKSPNLPLHPACVTEDVGGGACGERTDINGGRKQCLPDPAEQAQSNLTVPERQTGMGGGDSTRTRERAPQSLRIGSHGGRGRDRSCLLPATGARSSRQGLSSLVPPEPVSGLNHPRCTPAPCLIPRGTISAYRITA